MTGSNSNSVPPYTHPTSRPSSIYSLIEDRSAIFRLETPSASQQSLTQQNQLLTADDFAAALGLISPTPPPSQGPQLPDSRNPSPPAPAPVPTPSGPLPPVPSPWAPYPPPAPPHNLFSRIGDHVILSFSERVRVAQRTHNYNTQRTQTRRERQPSLAHRLRRRGATYFDAPDAPPAHDLLPYIARDVPASGHLYTIGGLLGAANEIAEENCVICLDSLVGDVVKLPCCHHYHRECARRCFHDQNRCPSCRHAFRLARR